MFIKIKRNPGSLIRIVFQKQCDILNTSENSCNNWAQSIKSLLDEMGFSDVWYNFDNTKKYLPLFKQRLRDQFIQEWREGINNMPKLESYAKFKTEFGREKYLSKITNEKLKKSFSKFRLGNHSLNIKTGRYTGITRDNSICKCCNLNMIENEYHFLLICPYYTNIRNKYIGRNSWPTIDKFNRLMKSESKSNLFKITRFIDKAFDLRKTK